MTEVNMFTIELLKIIPLVLMIIFLTLYLSYGISQLVHFLLLTERAFVLGIPQYYIFEGVESGITDDIIKKNSGFFIGQQWYVSLNARNRFSTMFGKEHHAYQTDYKHQSINYKVWMATAYLKKVIFDDEK